LGELLHTRCETLDVEGQHRQREEQQADASLGVQNAANSLGQAGGPLLGGVLFVWQMNAPYLLSGALLVTLALGIAWKVIEKRRMPSPPL